jgi:DNA-binding response OmpR family regulator
MQSDLSERLSTTEHLRKSGFDVIEAAHGDEARRVLEATCVDVVFADLEVSGQTNGLGVLHWLREHRPATKTVLTSGTEANIATVESYDIFLSKPYRMIDLDYCLRRVLAPANIPAKGTDPGGRPAGDKRDGRRDENPKQPMAELARQLAERTARQGAVDPAEAKAARRAALQAYDRVRGRRLRVGLGFAMGGLVGSGVASVFPTIGSWHLQPASSVEMATAAATPLPPSLPASVASIQPGAPASVESEPKPDPLKRDEVKEVQARLQAFGFNPGPVDGAVGPMTVRAVMNYQQERGQPQTGTVDSELLDQLRQDPSPQLAQRAARSVPRRSDPFEPVRTAGNRIGQWLNSLVR